MIVQRYASYHFEETLVTTCTFTGDIERRAKTPNTHCILVEITRKLSNRDNCLQIYRSYSLSILIGARESGSDRNKTSNFSLSPEIARFSSFWVLFM